MAGLLRSLSCTVLTYEQLQINKYYTIELSNLYYIQWGMDMASLTRDIFLNCQLHIFPHVIIISLAELTHGECYHPAGTDSVPAAVNIARISTQYDASQCTS